MIQGKWFAQGADLSEALSVRQAVFDRSADFLDSESQNVVIYEDGLPAATGRIWWRDGSFWLGDIGVLPASRGRHLGDLTLRLLLFKAQSHAAREVRLRCPRDLEGFFSRLGFRPDTCSENEVELFLPGDEIDLDTCRNCNKTNCPSRK